MAAVKPEWIEAGARAIGEHRKGHGWERDEDTWRNYTQIVEWALTAVEPLIRADEFELAYKDVIGRARAGHDHAEAVAAKLVEVICDMDDDHQIDEQALRYVRNQRDAARADAVALTDALDIAKDERYAARVEQARAEQRLRDLRAHAEAVAAKLVEVIRVDDLRLRTQKGHTAQARRERDAARAEVAALRELVEVQGRNIRREVLADLRAKVSSGWVPELDHEARIAVLALLDGADQ